MSFALLAAAFSVFYQNLYSLNYSPSSLAKLLAKKKLTPHESSQDGLKTSPGRING